MQIKKFDETVQIFYEGSDGVISPTTEFMDYEDAKDELQKIKQEFIDKGYEIIKETETLIKIKDPNENEKFSFIILMSNSV